VLWNWHDLSQHSFDVRPYDS